MLHWRVWARGIARLARTADGSTGTPAAGCHLAAMEIGDILTHDGRRYVVRGFDPEGVSPRLLYVEDGATGVRSILPFEDGSLRNPGGGRGFAS
jgi:hypothetical protein